MNRSNPLEMLQGTDRILPCCWCHSQEQQASTAKRVMSVPVEILVECQHVLVKTSIYLTSFSRFKPASVQPISFSNALGITYLLIH